MHLLDTTHLPLYTKAKRETLPRFPYYTSSSAQQYPRATAVHQLYCRTTAVTLPNKVASRPSMGR